jgi:transcriptional regulator with XRE-family HTH domain
MHEPLARKLRVLRAERGWTLNQAAERAGVQPETISDAEHGKRRPYTPTLSKIARGYGIPVEELVEPEAKSPKTPAPSKPSPGRTRLEETTAKLEGVSRRSEELASVVLEALRAMQEEYVPGEEPRWSMDVLAEMRRLVTQVTVSIAANEAEIGRFETVRELLGAANNAERLLALRQDRIEREGGADSTTDEEIPSFALAFLRLAHEAA